MLEAVTPEELADDGEYGEIVEDMKEECGKYGALRSLVIPRPDPSGVANPPGVGKARLPAPPARPGRRLPAAPSIVGLSGVAQAQPASQEFPFLRGLAVAL